MCFVHFYWDVATCRTIYNLYTKCATALVNTVVISIHVTGIVCAAGCIAGIVIACAFVLFIGALATGGTGYLIYRKMVRNVAVA